MSHVASSEGPGSRLASLLSPHRTEVANRWLGVVLAFVAGAANAGGFLVLHRYTSHMTGVLSSVADDLALGFWAAALGGLVLIACFLCGAASTAILVNWGRRHGTAGVYALPTALEALLLLVFGAVGGWLGEDPVWAGMSAGLLCYLMGLQNALITKAADAVIRTTHVTGMVTDLGIELGKMLYWNRLDHPDPALRVSASRAKLTVLSSLLGAFFVGGVCGALGFKAVGALAVAPLAGVLLVLAAPHVWTDVRRRG